MLHYVRGDGGMIVVPVSVLRAWVRARVASIEAENDTAAGVGSGCILLVMDLRDELEAIGR